MNVQGRVNDALTCALERSMGSLRSDAPVLYRSCDLA
jgi:hypothetical protein